MRTGAVLCGVMLTACGNIASIDGESADAVGDVYEDVTDVTVTAVDVPELTDSTLVESPTPTDGDDASTPPIVPEVVAGSRLQPRYEVTTYDDGSKQRILVGWFDTLRKVNCDLLLATDGVMRCLPHVGAIGGGPSTRWNQFINPACTDRVAEVFPIACGVASVPTYAEFRSDSFTCGWETRHGFALIGSEVPTPANLYFLEEKVAVDGTKTTKCILSNAPAGTRFFKAVESAPSDFVAAKITTEVPAGGDASTSPMVTEVVVGSRLKPRYQVTAFDDGAKQRKLVGWFDTARKVNCDPLRAADGVMRCLPQVSRFGAGFSDPACTNLVTILRACEGGFTSVPSYAGLYSAPVGVCEGTFRNGIALIGMEVATPVQLYGKGAGTTCVKAAVYTTATDRYFAVGPEIPATEFVALHATTEVP
ncbi:MAG: hypothetical protein NVSMB1_10450 [Polyangiales bacterium]